MKTSYPPAAERAAGVEARVKAMKHDLDTDDVFEAVRGELEDTLDEVILANLEVHVRDNAYFAALEAILVLQSRYGTGYEAFSTAYTSKRCDVIAALENLLTTSAALAKRLAAPCADRWRDLVGRLMVMKTFSSQGADAFDADEVAAFIKDLKAAKLALVVECALEKSRKETWGGVE